MALTYDARATACARGPGKRLVASPCFVSAAGVICTVLPLAASTSSGEIEPSSLKRSIVVLPGQA